MSVRNSIKDNYVKLQVFQIYNDEVTDLLVQDYNQLKTKIIVKKTQSGQVEVLTSSKILRNTADLINLVKFAQCNRQYLASQLLKIEPNEMSKKSHLVVRLILPDRNILDFVEMCGSEQAASTVT